MARTGANLLVLQEKSVNGSLSVVQHLLGIGMTGCIADLQIDSPLVCASFQQGAAPEVHIGEQGVDGGVGNQALGIPVVGIAVASLPLDGLHIADEDIQDLQLLGGLKLQNFGIRVDDLVEIGNILEGAD